MSNAPDVECPEPGCGAYFAYFMRQREHAEATGHRVAQRCGSMFRGKPCFRQAWHPGACAYRTSYGGDHDYTHFDSPLQRLMRDAIAFEVTAYMTRDGSVEEPLAKAMVELRRVMEQYADALGYPSGKEQDASVDREWMFSEYERWFAEAI